MGVFELSDEAMRTVEDFNDDCPTLRVSAEVGPRHAAGLDCLGSAGRSGGGVCVWNGADWSHQGPEGLWSAAC